MYVRCEVGGERYVHDLLSARDSSWQGHEAQKSRESRGSQTRSASGSSSEEVTLNWNKWVRQTHRWLSIAFTVAVIVNIVAVVRKEYAAWVGLLAVAPLALLFFSGMYLFVLPYATKWRSGRGTD
jgi:hypothetical protein